MFLNSTDSTQRGGYIIVIIREGHIAFGWNTGENAVVWPIKSDIICELYHLLVGI